MIIRPTNVPPFALILAAATLTAPAAFAESRQLDAHQHGHGTLNIAFEGTSVAMELEVPGADIVGFEHAAESAADRAAVDAAMVQLANPLELFVFPTAAGCALTAATVALHGGKDRHEGHDEHHDEAHDEDHGVKHSDGHEADHEAEHEEGHEDHGDAHAEKEESHTEFHAEYTLTCAAPSAINAIEFAYFERFPNAAELDIQMISDKGAKGFEVEHDEPRLSLLGAI